MVDTDAVRIEKAIRRVQESGDESTLIEVLLRDALFWPISDENDEEKMKFLDELNSYVMSIQMKYENA